MSARLEQERRNSALGGSHKVLLTFIFLLLVAPRVVLVPVGGSSVRIEDAVLAGMLLVLVARWKRVTEAGYRPTGVFLVSAVALVSTFVGMLMGSIDELSGVLYGARQIEYWVVFPLVWLALQDPGEQFQAKLLIILRWVTCLQVLVATLQIAGVLTFSFSKFALDRGAGLTAGPYELGALCAALACLWFARGEIVFGSVALMGTVISSSRISLLALLLGLILIAVVTATSKKHRSLVASRPSRVVALLLVAGLAVAASTTALGGFLAPVSERLQSTSLPTTWSYAADYASSVAPPVNSAQYAEVAYSSITEGVDFELLGSGGDTSNLVRFYRWHILLNSTDSSIEYLLGHGPSFAGPSVDGAILRIFIETGLLGVVAWLLMFRRISSGASPALLGIVATFVVGSVFIDVLFAMRPMILFWILIALCSSPKAAEEPTGVVSRPPDRTD